MPTATLEDLLAERFQIERPPTVRALTTVKDPVIFTHLRSTQAADGRSLEMAGEEGFVFQVPLTGPFFSNVWNSRKRTKLPPAVPGSIYLFDLSTVPVVSLDTPFDTLRMYIAQSTLDELAYDRGMRPSSGLTAQAFGQHDPVLYGMAQSLAAVMALPETASLLLTEYMALAFHEHVIASYGTSALPPKPLRGGLAPWQLRRAHEFISANLNGEISVTELASESGLSTSHFARAFKQTTGMAPHQWLTKKRIEHAKALLKHGNLELADVALACGFVDQSHFNRVFTRSEGHSPGRWRRSLQEF
ncbi:helix-turn-helix domain-containing protein [Pseudomonas sp. NA-150]|uniref:helix-turn-helix domain-containing protein n=1 Tax=Pseudomonas sp. NA-150 TaxID=3367525 RepID=UPI0037C892D6